MKKTSSFFEKEHFGKLFVRIVLGFMFISMGVRYFVGGRTALQLLGSVASVLGISQWPMFWGVLSAVILILSGMCFLIGFYFRSNCGGLFFIFLLKMIIQWHLSHDFFAAEFLFNMTITSLLFAAIFIGAGRFSADGH